MTAAVEPRFLHVAICDKKLTKAYALEILRLQEIERRLDSRVRRVGEIACELMYLTPAVCEEIEQRRKNAAASSFGGRDSLKNYWRSFRFLVPTNRVLGPLSLIAFVLSLALGAKTMAATTAFVSVASFVVRSLEMALPKKLDVRAEVDQVSRTLLLALLPATVALLGLISSLAILDPTVAPTAKKPVIALAVVSTIAAMVTSVILAFHRRQTLYMEYRHNALARAGDKVRRFLDKETVTEQEREELLKEIVRETANTLRRNPYVHYVFKALLGLRGDPLVSVWYLKPDSGHPGKFSVPICETPNCADSVKELLAEMQKEHHPAELNEDEYAKSLDRHRETNGRLNRETYLLERGRERFISLTGFVFARQCAQHDDDASRCIAFDGSVASGWKKRNLRRRLRQTLRFGAIAAYPVLSTGENPSSIGVLLAFENVRNGITGFDRGTLRVAARLIGALEMRPCYDSSNGSNAVH